jgi:hypothetical protein
MVVESIQTKTDKKPPFQIVSATIRPDKFECIGRKGFASAAFLTITIIVPMGGCGHRSPTPQDGTTASYEELRTFIGKEVTIRGRFSLRGKFGPYVLFGNQQIVYLTHKGSFTWGEPYSEMDGKLVSATGILGFSRSQAASTDPAIARPPDYYYFEEETVQLRLTSH